MIVGDLAEERIREGRALISSRLKWEKLAVAEAASFPPNQLWKNERRKTLLFLNLPAASIVREVREGATWIHCGEAFKHDEICKAVKIAPSTVVWRRQNKLPRFDARKYVPLRPTLWCWLGGFRFYFRRALQIVSSCFAPFRSSYFFRMSLCRFVTVFFIEGDRRSLIALYPLFTHSYLRKQIDPPWCTLLLHSRLSLDPCPMSDWLIRQRDGNKWGPWRSHLERKICISSAENTHVNIRPFFPTSATALGTVCMRERDRGLFIGKCSKNVSELTVSGIDLHLGIIASMVAYFSCFRSLVSPYEALSTLWVYYTWLSQTTLSGNCCWGLEYLFIYLHKRQLNVRVDGHKSSVVDNPCPLLAEIECERTRRVKA